MHQMYLSICAIEGQREHKAHIEMTVSFLRFFYTSFFICIAYFLFPYFDEINRFIFRLRNHGNRKHIVRMAQQRDDTHTLKL